MKCRSNVLLEKRDGKLNSVICDFGLARVQHKGVIFLYLLFFDIYSNDGLLNNYFLFLRLKVKRY